MTDQMDPDAGRGPTRRQFLRGGVTLAALAGVAPALSACAGGGGSSNGVTEILMWHGQTDTGKVTIDKLVAEFNKKNKKIKVNATTGTPADSMLEKITTSLASGDYPDIAYVFGPDIANVARSPHVADITAYTKKPNLRWNDFFPAARAAVTVNGHPRGFPALVDDLCVAYNKTVFAKAGVPAPKPGWTWDDFIATAKKLTNPGNGVIGTGWPADGGEDCVWRIYPLIWDLGGDVVSKDGKTVGFAGEPGLKALTVVHELAQNKAVYPDTKPGSATMYQLFDNNKMGMVPTGPWQLPDFEQHHVKYGIVPMPTFNGKPVTISGPDTWTVFDNGSDNVKAAVEFLTYLTDGPQDIRWASQAGSLPLRVSTSKSAGWQKHVQQTNGLGVFSTALSYARTRPTIRDYPKISEPLGQAIVAMLLGKSTPQAALQQAVQQANSALQSG